MTRIDPGQADAVPNSQVEANSMPGLAPNVKWLVRWSPPPLWCSARCGSGGDS